MLKGTIKFYLPEQQYGFITPDENDQAVYVHTKALEDHIRSGNKVHYELEEGRQGLVAHRVWLPDGSALKE